MSDDEKIEIEGEPLETPFGTVGMCIESGCLVEMHAEALKLGRHRFKVHLDFNCVGGTWHEDLINDEESGRFEVLNPDNELYPHECKRIEDHARRKYVPTLIQAVSDWAETHREALVKTAVKEFRRKIEIVGKDLCDLAETFEGEAEDLQYMAANALGEFLPIGRELEAAASEMILACNHLRTIAATMKRPRARHVKAPATGSSNNHNGTGVPLAAAAQS